MELHDVTITPDGAVLIDGEPCPYLIAPKVTAHLEAGIAHVTLNVLARQVRYSADPSPTQPQMTQADARAVFAKRNPAAFKETSA